MKIAQTDYILMAEYGDSLKEISNIAAEWKARSDCMYAESHLKLHFLQINPWSHIARYGLLTLHQLTNFRLVHFKAFADNKLTVYHTILRFNNPD